MKSKREAVAESISKHFGRSDVILVAELLDSLKVETHTERRGLLNSWNDGYDACGDHVNDNIEEVKRILIG